MVKKFMSVTDSHQKLNLLFCLFINYCRTCENNVKKIISKYDFFVMVLVIVLIK